MGRTAFFLAGLKPRPSFYILLGGCEMRDRVIPSAAGGRSLLLVIRHG